MDKRKREQKKKKRAIRRGGARLLYGSKRWKTITGVFMAVVVFVVTYLLVLPALTLDEQTAVEEPGISIASQVGESDVSAAGEATADASGLMNGEGTDYLQAELGEGVFFNPTDNGTAAPAPEQSSADGELFVEETLIEENIAELQEETENGWITDGGHTAEESSITAQEQILSEDTSNDELIEEVSEGLAEAGDTELLIEEEEYIGVAGTLTAEGADYKVALTFNESAGILEGAQISVAEIPQAIEGEESTEYEDFVEKANSVLPVSEIISFARFFDITIIKDGKEIHPAAPVEVVIELKDELDQNVKAIHFEEKEPAKEESDEIPAENEGWLVETVEEEETLVEAVEAEAGTFEDEIHEAVSTQAVLLDASLVNPEAPETTVTFETDGFSVFGIVGTETITTEYITADGDTYAVTVTYGPEAEIPANAALEVHEILAGEEDYEKYLQMAAETLEWGEEEFGYLKFLDITIVSDGEEIQPSDTVDVSIKLLDKSNVENSLQILHFGRDTEVLESEVTVDGTVEVRFETDGFSVYGIVTDNNELQNLDGKAFVIGNTNTRNVVIGEYLNPTHIKANNKIVTRKVNGKDYVCSDEEITEWKFISTGTPNQYYIQVNNGENKGQYLHVNGINNNDNNRGATLSNEPQALTVIYGVGGRAGQIHISNGNVYLNNSGGNTASGYGAYNDNGNNGWLTLAYNAPEYYVTKISAQNISEDEPVVLYRSVYDGNTYVDYVIDGNGDLIRAYDDGDQIGMRSAVSPFWKVTFNEEDHTYVFYNEETGMYLSPQSNGDVVSSDPADIILEGKEDGEFTSTILQWDEGTMNYRSLKVVNADEGMVLNSGIKTEAQEFSFAKLTPADTQTLHPVATIENAPVKITMFDYPSTAGQDFNTDAISNYTGHHYGYSGGNATYNIPDRVLQDGYPVFPHGTGSGADLFANGTVAQNTFFLQDVYDSTGYYEYSAFHNAAVFKNGKFTVYEETVMPGGWDNNGNINNASYNRGQFFPYNEIGDLAQYSHNTYDGDAKPLNPEEDPSYYARLHKTDGQTNYFFGMIMETDFIQPKDGLVDGGPMLYEFNGDDDLWVFIDDVLVLDIGGIHDAISGSINFQTGDVYVNAKDNPKQTTIREAFQLAGKEGDVEWDGNTFADYTSHTFKMFYLEHGAGASNLQVRFNLAAIEKKEVRVTKELDNTSQVDYANVSFAYQLILVDENGNETPFEETTAHLDDKNKTSIVFHDGVEFHTDGSKYDNVFYLKPNETAVFPELPENQKYYVRELGINQDYYDEITVNTVTIDGDTTVPEDGIYSSSTATVSDRPIVVFTNHCDSRNSNKLQIVKKLAEGSSANNAAFRFSVKMESAAGGTELVNYSGVYNIHDKEGIYYRYENGVLVENGRTPYDCYIGRDGLTGPVPPDYTIVIKDLLVGTDFSVQEVSVRENGSATDTPIANSNWELVSIAAEDCDGSRVDGTAVSGSIAFGKDAKVTVTNKDKADVKLKKVKEDFQTIIGGSEFRLATLDGEIWEAVSDVESTIRPGAAADVNPADIGGLPVGRYRLEEKSAPDGYIILTSYIYFEVYKDATEGKLKARLTDEDGQSVDSADRAIIDRVSSENDEYYLVTVKNIPGEALPNTGGIGTTIFYVVGAILVVGAAVLLVTRRRVNAK